MAYSSLGAFWTPVIAARTAAKAGPVSVAPVVPIQYAPIAPTPTRTPILVAKPNAGAPTPWAPTPTTMPTHAPSEKLGPSSPSTMPVRRPTGNGVTALPLVPLAIAAVAFFLLRRS